jgi:hypothetical protein
MLIVLSGDFQISTLQYIYKFFTPAHPKYKTINIIATDFHLI